MDHHQEQLEEKLLQIHRAIDCFTNPYLKRPFIYHHQLMCILPHRKSINNHKVVVCSKVLEQLWLKVWHSVQLQKWVTKLLDTFLEELVAIKNSLLLLNKWLLNKGRLNLGNNIIILISNKTNSSNFWKNLEMIKSKSKRGNYLQN
jgi:hypothetical protein